MAAVPASSRASVASGVAMGVTANFTWGLAFLVPVLLAAYNPIVITLGRYVAYGAVSLLLLAVGRRRMRGVGRRAWMTAAAFALAGNVGYYFFLVQGIALVGAPVVVVVIGTLPVTVSLYGNWRRRESPFKRLRLPLGLIVVGLALVNAVEIDWSGVGEGHLAAQLAGVGCAFAAVFVWTWYAVANATFLKAHPEITPGSWSTAVGIMTLAISLVASPALLFGVQAAGPPPASTAGTSIWWLVGGSLVLGIVVSWGGTLLWNQASRRLPVSVAGQLIVFETISGLTYVFVATQQVPPLPEVAGILIVIAGVLIGFRRSLPPQAVPGTGPETPASPDPGGDAASRAGELGLEDFPERIPGRPDRG